MSEFQLYNYFRSSASYRIRIALHFKGLEFEYHPVHLLNKGGEQHSAEYKKLNPAAEVPTLVHNGYVLSQSMAILEYLDQVAPSIRVFPADAKLGGKVRQFCEDINAGIQPLQNLKVIQFLEKDLAITPEQKQMWITKWLGANLVTLEASVHPKGPHAFGADITAADMFLIPQLFAAHRLGAKIEDYPKLMKVRENGLAHPAFKAAHPHNQVDTPAELKGQF